jgi:hypothetical protein
MPVSSLEGPEAAGMVETVSSKEAPMQGRPRIDLDGVALNDESKPYMVVAIFRYRAVEGLCLLVPESTDVLVPWAEVESAALDLVNGDVRVVLRPEYVAAQNWLRGARTLVGRWMDRYTKRSSP